MLSSRSASSIFLIGIACSGDTVLDKTNSNPLAEITSHTDGATVEEGYPEYLRGVVSDLSNPFDQLTTTWLVNGTAVCDEIVPDQNGVTDCSYAFSAGDTDLSLEVRDPEGGAGAAFVSIVVSPTEAPVAEIVSPRADIMYYADRLTTLEGLVSDAEDDPADLSIVWESSIDGVLSGGASTPDSEGLLLGATHLSAGEHFLTLTATDLSGKNGRTSVTVLVIEENTAPVCTITNPTNNAIIVREEMAIFSATVSDAEAPLTALSLSWTSSLDGYLGSGTLDTDGILRLETEDLSAGEHEITLTVEDDLGATCSSSLSVIINTPPSTPVLSVSPNPANTTDTLLVTASGAQDAEGNPVSYTYDWTLNGGSFSTSDTLSSSETTKGDIWLIEVTPADSWSSGLPASTTITIGNAAPEIQTASLSQSTVHAGDILTCSVAGTDPDPMDNLTADYLWSDGSIGSTYTVSSTDAVGSIITCTGTLSDGDGGTDQLSLSATVVNSSPTSSVSISPSQPSMSDSLTCTVTAADADGDSLTTNFSWSINGSPVSATTASNTESSLEGVFLGADSVTCTATTTDGLGGASVATASVVISNTAPVSTVSISPSQPTLNDLLTCTVTASDVDGNTLTTNFSWSVNGSPVSATTASNLDATLGSGFGSGDSVTCTAITTDGLGGASTATASVLIGNSPPTLSAPSITVPLYTSDLAVVLFSVSDAENDPLTTTVEWFVNGGSVQLASTTTLDGMLHFNKGDSVYAIVTTTDNNTTVSETSNTVVVSNSAPSISTPVVLTSPLYTNDLATLSFSSSDDDGDPITTAIEWFVDGGAVQNGSLTTLDGVIHFDKGEAVYAIITATDNQDTQTATSNIVSVLNSAPEAPVLSFLPSDPLAGETLQCQIDLPSNDADGDSISYTFDWYNTGAIYNGASTTAYAQDTISSNITQAGENWTCLVTPDDGLEFGDDAEISVMPCHAILAFDGGNDMITIDNLNTMTGNQTMEAWVRFDSSPTSSRQLMSSQCGSMWVTPTEINVQTINGCLGASGGCKSGYTNDSSWIANNKPSGDGGFGYTGWDGSWKHVAVTIDTGHVATLYIDGISQGTRTLSSDGCMSATTIGTIGRHNVYGNAILGDIASIRMSSALVYSGNFTPSYPLLSTSSTEALFGLQSDYNGTSLTDESGQGHHAIINDVTWDIGGPECP